MKNENKDMKQAVSLNFNEQREENTTSSIGEGRNDNFDSSR